MKLPKNFIIITGCMSYADNPGHKVYDKVNPTNTAWGGELSDIPKPHKRWFDDPKKIILVKISIAVYASVGHHYYVNIEECDNPIWNKKEKYWQVPFRDVYRPWHESKRCENEKEAKAFILEELTSHYGKKKVVVHLLKNGDTWFYKDGD